MAATPLVVESIVLMHQTAVALKPRKEIPGVTPLPGVLPIASCAYCGVRAVSVGRCMSCGAPMPKED